MVCMCLYVGILMSPLKMLADPTQANNAQHEAIMFPVSSPWLANANTITGGI